MPQNSRKSSPNPTASQTPAMRQWTAHKAQVGDAILLFRMGDFYETFYDDAKTVARVLGLTLTARSKGDNPIPLAGIPYHALDSYLARLVRAGYRVAISEQTEDPRNATGVVKRDVVRVVTPGTLTEDNLLPDSGSNNYLAAVRADGSELGAACLDLTTGDFFSMSGGPAGILAELARMHPAEILVPEQSEPSEAHVADQLHDLAGTHLTRRPAHEFDAYHAERYLHEQFGVRTLEGFGYSAIDAPLCAAGALIGYLKETQKSTLTHLARIRPRVLTEHMHIDPYSWRCLEVERTLRLGTAEGSLLAAVNRTTGAMGARRLRQSLRFPLRRPQAIRDRQEAVADLHGDPRRLGDVRRLLAEMCDIERITARVGVGRCTPRDLRVLGQSLARIGELGERLQDTQAALLASLLEGLGDVAPLADHLLAALQADAPLTVREGGIFAPGVDAELDRLRGIGRDGRQWLARYQAEQIQRTRIPSLKVGFNKVFGYYIEITHTHRELVPGDYVRKQTVKNAERYITDELKTYETEVLTARERSDELEYELFEALKAHVAGYTDALLRTAHSVGTIDLLAGFATLAAERGYVRPELVDQRIIDITAGRHPALEAAIGPDFVPNDTHLDGDHARLLILTGPNMAGKSTYIRQVALLTLLAQTGSYVPAAAMRFGVVDRVFTRVGASDELARGQSTFMVEMIEAANILNNATADSLVILDELGRGTSTYDGLSLAWAISEHIALGIGCRTLFATHYHELTELAQLLPGVRNYNVLVREWPAEGDHGERIVFLHKIVEGGTDRSYGVHVAKIAGIPPAVIERSREVLRQLESGLSRQSLREVLSGTPASPQEQLELFAVQDDRLRQGLLEIDIDRLTPLEALQQLKKLQDQAR